VKFTIHPEAQDEATSTVAWYRERNLQVAERLAELFGEAIEEIARHPDSFPRLEYRRNPGNIRRARLKGFPLKVLFQIRDDEIFVFAVAHDSRRPGYWRKRLQ
jgi:plasmid stabilization system protein ParE